MCSQVFHSQHDSASLEPPRPNHRLVVPAITTTITLSGGTHKYLPTTFSHLWPPVLEDMSRPNIERSTIVRVLPSELPSSLYHCGINLHCENLSRDQKSDTYFHDHVLKSYSFGICQRFCPSRRIHPNKSSGALPLHSSYNFLNLASSQVESCRICSLFSLLIWTESD